MELLTKQQEGEDKLRLEADKQGASARGAMRGSAGYRGGGGGPAVGAISASLHGITCNWRRGSREFYTIHTIPVLSKALIL